MTVKVTKPALNIREKLAELNKPTGLAGEALLRADSVQEQRDLINAGRKNLIINGGFDVWQRGTSQTSTGYGCADRWGMHRVTNGAQRSTDVPNGDFKYSMQYTSLTTGMIDLWMRQYIEDYGRVIRDTSKTFTVSFWAKANRVGVVSVDLNDRNHGSITVDTTWQKYSHTFTGDALYAGDNAMLDFGSNENAWTINITGIQLELGSVATEFDNSRSYGEELALCSRYYQYLSYWTLFKYGHWNYRVPLPFGEMRATPSFSYTSVNTVDGGGVTQSNDTFSAFDNKLFWVASASAVFRAYWFVGAALDAEL